MKFKTNRFSLSLSLDSKRRCPNAEDPVMDDCAAAMVLMSLSCSPNSALSKGKLAFSLLHSFRLLLNARSVLFLLIFILITKIISVSRALKSRSETVLSLVFNLKKRQRKRNQRNLLRKLIFEQIKLSNYMGSRTMGRLLLA